MAGLLDVGCADQHMPGADLVEDMDPEYLPQWQADHPDVTCFAQFLDSEHPLPMPDGSYSVIHAKDSIGQWRGKQLESIMKELDRLLCYYGIIVITTVGQDMTDFGTVSFEQGKAQYEAELRACLPGYEVTFGWHVIDNEVETVDMVARKYRQ